MQTGRIFGARGRKGRQEGEGWYLLEHLLKLSLEDDHALPVGRVPDVSEIVDALTPPVSQISLCIGAILFS